MILRKMINLKFLQLSLLILVALVMLFAVIYISNVKSEIAILFIKF